RLHPIRKILFFFFSSRRRHTRFSRDWSSDVCSSDLVLVDWTPVSVIAMTLAMGTENSVFRRHGETTVALTYVTGALVKIGQRIAAAFFGGPRWSWLPYLGLWGGLVTGAVLGALAHRALGLHALWIAAAFAATLTVSVRFLSA